MAIDSIFILSTVQSMTWHMQHVEQYDLSFYQSVIISIINNTRIILQSQLVYSPIYATVHTLKFNF